MTVLPTTILAVTIMEFVEKLIAIIDKYMLEIVISSVIAFIVLFLIRSFKRSMLIERGQARFVLEQYDVKTDKIHKWLSLFIFLIFLPLLAYVKYLKNFAWWMLVYERLIIE